MPKDEAANFSLVIKLQWALVRIGAMAGAANDPNFFWGKGRREGSSEGSLVFSTMTISSNSTMGNLLDESLKSGSSRSTKPRYHDRRDQILSELTSFLAAGPVEFMAIVEQPPGDRRILTDEQTASSRQTCWITCFNASTMSAQLEEAERAIYDVG
ncbi:hypothetical protein CDD80_6641 [Ophiocordyceps camponoti-rufipedis]|uniref:Uncharacterized protein n=1 Tax=Ophiocordyceps camponoti-rufipedis TaxID=2004952 RepID=A0A2C5YPD3_9HYPO|nr:hypothetical protein CDD80_6641 [Ophiocordyceps camponoti-rufipedis]